jgi:Domain of unknown function (DUF4263)
MMGISINTTSRNSGIGQDITLRQTDTTRLIFRPEVINNEHNPDASVKGCFIFQKKKGKDLWENHKDLDLSNLRAEEWIRLKINSSELFTLFNEIKKYYTIHKEYGVKHGSYSVYKANPNIEKVIAFFENNKNLYNQMLNNEKGELFEQTMQWIVNTDNSEKIVEKFLKLNEKDLDQLNSLIGITNLKKILSVWENHKENKSEKFWQDLLKENTWVLSQIFSNPTVLIDNEAYVGGKTTNNDKGKVVDFLYANPFSKDAVLIEIKTPSTTLLTTTEYRAGVYSVHKDLAGAVSQVLSYKGSLQKEYTQILYNNFMHQKPIEFDVINPCCVVIAGRFESLDSPALRHSFELYRKELKNVIVITFDELFMKIKHLIDLLSE